MGGTDRKSRRGGARHEKGLRPGSAKDAYGGGDDDTDVRAFAAAVAKSAQIEAQHFGVEGAARKPTLSELAHVPSPHRRRGQSHIVSSSPAEHIGAEASPTTSTSTYRDQLRANGQRALQRAWDYGITPRPGLPPPPAPPLHTLISGGASPSAHGANMNMASGQEQYLAMCCAGMQQSPTHQWTGQGSTGFWADPGLELPQTQMVSMQECQAAHLVGMPQMLSMPVTPSTMVNATAPTDGLMAIAMPQCCEINGEQIVAQLLAAAPMCYED